MNDLPLFLIINTHTDRHLETVLSGVKRQRVKPTAICVTVDGKLREIEALVTAAAVDMDFPVLLVQREYQGSMMASQSRNNGVRGLLSEGLLSKEDVSAILVFIDGDIFLAPENLALHTQTTCPGTFTIGDRINLSDSDAHAFLDEASYPPGEERRLRKSLMKAKKHKWLRRLKWMRKSKPKMISAQFSVSFADFLAINGFDEAYIGYGAEDDDFAARLYKRKVVPHLGIMTHKAFHLWHPTQAKKDWKANPGVMRYLKKESAGMPVWAEFGLDKTYPPNPFEVKRLV